MRQKNMFWKIMFLILILNVIGFSTRTKPVYAQPTQVLVLPPENTGEPGTTFLVLLYISGVPSPGAVVWQLRLRFDPGVLDVPNPDTDIAEGEWLNKDWSVPTMFEALRPAAYHLFITCYLMESGSTTGEGVLAYITFTVVGPGESALDLYDTELLMEDGSPLYPAATDGTFYTDTPKADFTYDHKNSTLRNPVVGETITFNASDSYDPDPGGEITSYKWEFGDGNTKTYVKDVNLTDTTTHSYAQRGDYSVKLTVADNSGPPPLTNSKSVDVHVALRDIAVTDLMITPAAATAGTIVNINVTVTNVGYETEYFNVSLYYDDIPIWYNPAEGQKDFCLPLEKGPGGLPPAPALLPAKSLEIAFKWNTTGVPEQPYTILANACTVVSSGQLRETFEDVEIDYTNNAKQGDAWITSTPKNIAVIDITVSPTAVEVGKGPITINVTVQNQGVYDETFSVSVFYDKTLIENRTDVFLPAHTTTTPPLTFVWDTTIIENGTYTITANASLVPDEVILSDNTRTYGDTISISYAPTAYFTYSPDAPKVGDTVSFDASDSTDLDGTIQNYVWGFGDGSPLSSGKTASHTYLHAITYNVNLTVTDDATLNTTLVRQIGIDKASSTISISVSQAIITYGDSVTINGSITPVRPQVDVTLLFRIQGEQTWSNFSIQKTNATGHYVHTWTPPAAKTYEVRATWPGDADTVANVSTFVSITVNKAASVITALASPKSVSVGSNITITGAITPARTGVTVTIQVRTPGEAENTLGTAVTDAGGGYSYTWTPTEKGTFEIRAVWGGDDNTLGDQSEWETVEVKEVPPPTKVYYIAAAIAVAAIVIVVSVYFLKIRK